MQTNGEIAEHKSKTTEWGHGTRADGESSRNTIGCVGLQRWTKTTTIKKDKERQSWEKRNNHWAHCMNVHVCVCVCGKKERNHERATERCVTRERRWIQNVRKKQKQPHTHNKKKTMKTKLKQYIYIYIYRMAPRLEHHVMLDGDTKKNKQTEEYVYSYVYIHLYMYRWMLLFG